MDPWDHFDTWLEGIWNDDMGVPLYSVYSDKFLISWQLYSRYSSMLILVSFWPEKLEVENMLTSMLINKPAF